MPKEMSERTKKLLLMVLIIGGFFSTLNQTLLNVALNDFMVIFKVDANTVQWLSTGFMLVNGICVPITAYLMKRFSTRQLFISSMSFLLIGSIVAASTSNFSVLLTGRMIQAAGAGIIMPLMMTVIVYLFPVEQRGKMMGKVGFAIIFAPAIAPTLAGFILDYFSWQWLFLFIIPFATIVIILACKYMVNVTEPQQVKLDMLSVIYSTFGFGALLYGFSSAGGRGWSDVLVLAMIVGGVFFTTLFVMRQLASKEPLLNLRVFKSNVYTMTSIINIAITVLMYADLILLPLYLQSGQGYSAFVAGLILLPGAIINALLSPTAGKLFDKFGAKPLFIAGTALIAISMLGVINITPETSMMYIIVRTIVLRVGLACISMPLNTAALNALPRELASHGSAVNNTVRQLAGAIGTAVIVTLYSQQLTTAHEVGTLESYAQAASGTYMYMLIVAIISFVLAWFTPVPKKEIAS